MKPSWLLATIVLTLPVVTNERETNGAGTTCESAPSTRRPCIWEWTRMESGTVEYLHAVWGTGPDCVIAAGGNGTLLSFDGEHWTLDPSAPQDGLFSVWSTPENDWYIGGSYGAIYIGAPGDWTATNCASDMFVHHIYGFSASDIYAGGGYYSGYIDHYDGESWTLSHTNGAESYAIWGAAPDDVFACGWHSILHFDGSAWMPMEHEGQHLSGVWGAAGDDVFIVGRQGAILHYDGFNWSPMESGTTENLADVEGTSSDDVFAVGDNGVILHFNGIEWSNAESGVGENLSDALTLPSGDVFIVGSDGVILHGFAPSPTPTIIPSPSPSPTPTTAPTSPPPTATNPPTTLPTTTASPTSLPADRISISLIMPAHQFAPGDDCLLEAVIENPSGAAIHDVAHVVMLDAGVGVYWFWPSWNRYPPDIDCLRMSVLPGTATITVIPEFAWPSGTTSGTASFLAALLNPPMTEIMGDTGRWEFRFGP